MRTDASGGFEHAGAQALAAHLHQAEGRDAADLDAGAIVLQRLLHRLLDLTDVRSVLHVDEVDDDEAGHVAQAQLAGDLVRGLEVGRGRGLLDVVLAGGAARVDVDRDQRLGRVDDQIAARLELHDRLVHCRQLILDPEALEERNRVHVGPDLLRVARHEQLHIFARRAIAVLALDDHLVDLAGVDVADGALHEVRIFVDQRWCLGLQRVLTDAVPEPREIVEVALDLDLGTREARGADDAAHGLGQLHLGHDRLQPLAIGDVRDLPRDAATVRGVGHQHAVAAGERQIGGERRALVAALFLDDLHQQHLTAADNVLDLVATAQILATAAQRLDMIALAVAAGRARARGPGGLAILMRMILGSVEILGAAIGVEALDRGRVDVVRSVLVMIVVVVMILLGQRERFLGLLAEQGVTILLGDLVIVGVDFREGQEAVAVAAELDEGSLERRLHTRHLGEIDVALELLPLGRFEIEFLDPVTLGDRDPGLFRVARVDEHAHRHYMVSGRAGRRVGLAGAPIA